MKVDTSDIPEAGEEWFRKARLVLPQRRSELEEARAHLLYCQDYLKRSRAGQKYLPDEYETYMSENHVLAALSWVWDAQERAGLNRDIVTPVRVGPGIVVMFVNKGARGDG